MEMDRRYPPTLENDRTEAEKLRGWKLGTERGDCACRTRWSELA